MFSFFFTDLFCVFAVFLTKYSKNLQKHDNKQKKRRFYLTLMSDSEEKMFVLFTKSWTNQRRDGTLTHIVQQTSLLKHVVVSKGFSYEMMDISSRSRLSDMALTTVPRYLQNALLTSSGSSSRLEWISCSFPRFDAVTKSRSVDSVMSL